MGSRRRRHARRALVSLLLLCLALAALAACSDDYTGKDVAVASDGGVDDADGSTNTSPPDGASADVDVAPCSEVAPVADTFATPGGVITNLVSDATHVYWLADSKRIERAPFSGGGVEKLRDLSPDLVATFVATSGFVVYASNGAHAILNAVDPPVYLGSVLPLAARDGVVVGSNGDTLFRGMPPAAFGAIGSRAGVSAATLSASSLFVVAPAGDGSPGTAIFSFLNAMNPQIPTLAFAAPGYSPTQIAADGSELFMLDADRGEVFKAAPGGAPLQLATGEPGLGRIAVQGKQVYYSTANGIRRVQSDGAGCKAVLSTTAVVAFTVSATHVYFASGSGIVRVPR